MQMLFKLVLAAIEAQLLNRFADYGTKLNGTDVESNIEHTNHRAELADKYQIGNADRLCPDSDRTV